MINFKKHIDKLKQDIFIYFLFGFLFTFLLFASNITSFNQLWNSLLLFHFEGTLLDFKSWYPNFGILLYYFLFSVKILSVLSTLFLINKVLKNTANFLKSKKIDTTFCFKKFLVRQSKILITIILYYLFLYFIFKIYFKNDFFNLQVLIARGFLLQILLVILKTLFDNRLVFLKYLKVFLFKPQLPYSISIFRILFFAYLIFIYLIQFSRLSIISLGSKVSLPFIGWFIDIIPVSSSIYLYFLYVGIACCLFIIVGFKTRFFLVLNAVCVFYIMATPNFFGKLWHMQLVIWIAWFFTFSRCYDVFSIDAKFNKNAEIKKSSNYTFPIRFIWLQFGIIYFWAGFYKLWDCGFDWALGQSMVNQVQLEWLQAYDEVPSIRIDYFPSLLYVGGFLTILFELAYLFLILKPKTRWIAALGGLIMHNVVGYFMYISFLVMLQVFYVFYIDFNYFFKNKIQAVKNEIHFSKLSFYSGILILSFNFVFGMFHVDSYPFSSYPTYSAIIPDSIKIIDFRASKLSKSVHDIGKENNFRWEDYGWLENKLINDFEQGEKVQQRLEDYWAIWESQNPQLKACDTIDVFLIERPVAPEGKTKSVTLNKMGIIIK